MSIAIDLVIVVIALFCTMRGLKNGIIRGICGLIALAISIFAANIIATAYSGEFTGMLKPFVGGVVDNVITDIFTENTMDAGVSAETWLSGGLYNAAYSAMRRVGLPEKPAESIAASLVQDSIVSISDLSDLIADKLSSLLAYAAVFGICFVLLAIAFSVIGNILNYVFAIPGIEKLDSIIGAVLGLLKALIIIYTVALVARYIGLLTAPAVDNTVILKFIINVNPIALILGV